MWRHTYAILRKTIVPRNINDNGGLLKKWYSSRSRSPRSMGKITLVSAGVGMLIGAGYGGYTHYKINMKRDRLPVEEDYLLLNEAPAVKPHYKIINDNDKTNLKITLFQYTTCPFCCKVRAFLDHHNISYDVVEVDAVLRQAIKWSTYKKVPIVLVKVDNGYQQLVDSTAIVSMLETYMQGGVTQLDEIVKYYPANKYVNEEGKNVTDIPNKYFIMHNAAISEKQKKAEIEERDWRQWADNKLVHLLSPNVYRTLPEAIDTFQWFQQVGDWKRNFPAWECAVMVYGGAFAMWLISKRLKKRHNLEDEVRRPLFKAGNEWMQALKAKGTQFMGGDQPNLADLSAFGVFSSMEGTQAYADLNSNTEIGKWYQAVKASVNQNKRKLYLQ